MVAGATGLVGRECLRLLATDDSLGEVRAIVRRPLPAEAHTLGVRGCRIDFDHLDEHPEWFQVDWVFCALGTTLRQAGSRAAFRQVDFEYPLAIAKAARAQGARHSLWVSAVDANARSGVFYSRVKGELEEAALQLGYPSVTIARPSLLLGDRTPSGFGEEFAKRVAWLFPFRWKPVPARQVALALILSARADAPGVHILENPLLRATA